MGGAALRTLTGSGTQTRVQLARKIKKFVIASSHRVKKPSNFGKESDKIGWFTVTGGDVMAGIRPADGERRDLLWNTTAVPLATKNTERLIKVWAASDFHWHSNTSGHLRGSAGRAGGRDGGQRQRKEAPAASEWLSVRHIGERKDICLVY